MFDLDGTVTAEETLPIIAKHFSLEKELDQMTQDAVGGNVPWVESFIRRVFILGKLPVDEISDLLFKTKLNEKVLSFIHKNHDNCAVATGNLDCWIDKLAKKIGCCVYCSNGVLRNNQVEKISMILKKENIVEHYKAEGEKVIFIGDGNNDLEAMRYSDISIASGIVHMPAKSVLAVADYLIFEEETLCRQLNQLL